MEPRNNGVPDSPTERQVKESAMIGTVLSLAAGYLAMIEADSGNARAAEATIAANRRLIELAIRGLPPDSFGRAYLPEFLGYYGYPTTGFGYGAYGPVFAARDYETLRKEARASVRRLEQIKNATPEQELRKNRSLEVAYRTAAEGFVSARRLRRSGRGDQEGARDSGARSRHAPSRRSAMQVSS